MLLPACQMQIPDSAALAASGRRIFMMKQFNNIAIHLLFSSLGSGVAAMESISDYNLQKTLLREIKLWKDAPEDGAVLWNGGIGRWHSANRTNKSTKQRASQKFGPDDDHESDFADEVPTSSHRVNALTGPIKKPTKPSPVLYAYYGALMMVAKSYQSAICTSLALPVTSIRALLTSHSCNSTDYLTHAHLIDPVDPLISFQLALCYLGRAFQRQCDNRNHCIAQVRLLLSAAPLSGLS